MRLFRPRIWRESASIILTCPSAAPTRYNAAVLDTRFESETSSELKRKRYDYRLVALERTKDVQFMPSMVAFPGGGLDLSDLSPEWLRLLENTEATDLNQFGQLRDEEVKPIAFREMPQFDDRSKSPWESPVPLEVAFRICALREAFEECGVLIAKPLDVCDGRRTAFGKSTTLPLDILTKWQKLVVKDANNFLHLCREEKIFPDIWSLSEWSNWLTPAGLKLPYRYDAVFYMCCLESQPKTNIGDNENVTCKFYTPLEMLSDCFARMLRLPVPQVYENSRLAAFESFKSLATFALEREQLGTETYCTKGIILKDGGVHVLPGDEMYPENFDFASTEGAEKVELTLKEFLHRSQHIHRGESLRDDIKINIRCNIQLPKGHCAPYNSLPDYEYAT